MLELKGNLFEPYTYMYMPPPCRGWIPLGKQPDAICITTNRFVKSNGRAVMGRGCAKQALVRWPNIDTLLGTQITQGTHLVGPLIENDPYSVLSFPVKPSSVIVNTTQSNVVQHMRSKFAPGSRAPGWAACADPLLIAQSAADLVKYVNWKGWKLVVLPRPGCGAGELNWKDVQPILAMFLDNRFACITF